MKFKIQISSFKIIKIPFEILSSKAFLLWIIGGWITYYVLSAIRTKEAFASFISGLHNNPLIYIPFVLFLISGYLNLIRASKDFLRRGILQSLAWSIIPIGALLFFTGFLLSIFMRYHDQQLVGEGDAIKAPWSAQTYLITRVEPGLRESFLDIEADKGIFSHEPKLTVLDESSNSYEIRAFPPAKILGTYYHILNFGLAPAVRLLEDGNIRSEGYMALRILFPGSSDYFEIPPYPYRFVVTMEPEKIFQRERVLASQFSLKKPLYRVKIYKGEKIVAEGDSREEVLFDNLSLQFIDSTFWVLLEIVKDPGIPVMRIGIFLMFIGIPVSFLRLLLRLLKHY